MGKKQKIRINSQPAWMQSVGLVILFIALMVWSASSDGLDPNRTGQAFAKGIGLFGAMLVALGWVAEAICREIAKAAQGGEAERQGEYPPSTR